MRGRKQFVDRLRVAGGPSHELLVLLDAHRVLTTGQLARASGAPERTTRHRLERLHSAGLVDYRRPGRESGSAPRHWWLRPAGARIVAGTPAADGRASAMFAAHAAVIAEVWLAVREHGPAAGLRVTGWAADRAGWQEWEQPSGYGTPRRLTPDAVLRAEVRVDGLWQPTVALLEIDLATMTQGVLREKLTRYLAYATDRAWADRFPHCPPLLLLTTTASRAAGFIRAAGRMLAAADREHRSDYRYRYSGLDYEARTDLIHADALVVAACGLVRTPELAVTDTCWLLPAVAAATVALPELLTERVTAIARARAHLARAAAEAERAQQAFDLHAAGGDPDATDTLGRTGAEALTHLTRYTDDDLLDTDPDLAAQILAWHEDPDHPDSIAVLRAALRDRHAAMWAGQVRTLLAAAARIAAGDPQLAGHAARLQAGRLLKPWHLTELADPAVAPDPPRPADPPAAYLERRDRRVREQHRALPWLARRRVTLAELAAAYDERHLAVCDTCATITARPEPADDDDPYAPAMPAEEHEYETGCRHCRAGTLTDYRHRHRVPTLTQRLDDLRRRLP